MLVFLTNNYKQFGLRQLPQIGFAYEHVCIAAEYIDRFRGWVHVQAVRGAGPGTAS